MLKIFLNLSEGNIKEFRFKIQEGTNIFDLENQLRLSDLSFDCPEFNCLSNKFNFIEGTLMPDTYFYNFKSSASSILIKSQNSFIKYAFLCFLRSLIPPTLSIEKETFSSKIL